MVRPDHQGGALTLERQLEQLKETLPPNEQEVLGRLLREVSGLRNSDLDRTGPGEAASEMPADEMGGAGGEMPGDLTPATTGGVAVEPLNGGGMPTAGNEMPTATTATTGSDLFPDGPNEMPEARGMDVPTSMPDRPEPEAADAAPMPEAATGNEMPSAMPGFGADHGMPMATSVPY